MAPKSPVQKQLCELTRLRAPGYKIPAQLRPQRPHLPPQRPASQDRLLRKLNAQIKQVTTQIKALLRQEKALKTRAEALQEEKGVGALTAAVLLVEVLELGTLNRARVAALVGVAPFNRDSGRGPGRHFITDGRARARPALYLAGLVARRHHPQLKRVYERLLPRGKLKKIAWVALMRLLRIRLNLRLKEL